MMDVERAAGSPVPWRTGPAASGPARLPAQRGWLVLAAAMGPLAAAVAVAAGPLGAAAVIAACVVGAVAIRAPGLLFAAYLLIPFYKGALQPYSPIDITVGLSLLVTAQIVPVALDRRTRSASGPGLALWFAIGVLVVLGVTYAPDQDAAARAAVTFWALVLVPLVVGALRITTSRRHLGQFLWGFAAMGALTTVLGIVQLSATQRLLVLDMNTIHVARSALLVPLLTVTLIVPGRRRPLAIGAGVLSLAAILVALASGSRGPVLVLALIAAIGAVRYLFRTPALVGRRLLTVTAVTLALVISLVLVSSLVPSQSMERFQVFGEFATAVVGGDATGAGADTSSTARVRLFGLAITMFADHPLLGAGTAGFKALSPLYVGPALADAYPHNALLQFLAEFGLVGAGVFVAITVIALRRRLPSEPVVTSIRVLAVFFLLNAMVTGNILEDRMAWGLLVMLLVLDVPPGRVGGRVAPPPDGPG